MHINAIRSNYSSLLASLHPEAEPSEAQNDNSATAVTVDPPRVGGWFGPFLSILYSHDPQLSSDSPQARYASQQGELFGSNGPTIENVRQGKLGDCYLLAAVGAIAAKNPESIREMIRDEGNGFYKVRFFRENNAGEYEPVWITVDADLPVDENGNLLYAQGVDSDADFLTELWVPLIEKAYARFRDAYHPRNVHGYDYLDEGGAPSVALQALFGEDARFVGRFQNDEHLTETLSAANLGEHVVVTTVLSTQSGWASNHAYTVLNVREEDGVTLVTLRNPWGYYEPAGPNGSDGSDDGTFTVPLDDLRTNMHGVYTSAPKTMRSTFQELFAALNPVRLDLQEPGVPATVVT